MLLHRHIALLALHLPAATSQLRARVTNVTSAVSIETGSISSVTPASSQPLETSPTGAFLPDPLNILLASVNNGEGDGPESLTIISISVSSSSEPVPSSTQPQPAPSSTQPAPTPRSTSNSQPILNTLTAQTIPTSIPTTEQHEPTINSMPIPSTTPLPTKPTPSTPTGPSTGPPSISLAALPSPSQPSAPLPQETAANIPTLTPLLPIQAGIHSLSFNTDAEPGGLPLSFSPGTGGPSPGGSGTGTGSGPETKPNPGDGDDDDDDGPRFETPKAADTSSEGSAIGPAALAGIIIGVVAFVTGLVAWVRECKRAQFRVMVNRARSWARRMRLMVTEAMAQLRGRFWRRGRTRGVGWDVMVGGVDSGCGGSATEDWGEGGWCGEGRG